VYWIGELNTRCPYRANDDYEVLKVNDFEENFLKQIPKHSWPYSVFKGFPCPGKLDTFFQTLNDNQGNAATRITSFNFQGIVDGHPY